MADRAHHGPGASPRETTGAESGPRGDIVDGAAGRRTQDPSGWLIVRRDGTVVAAERRACELLGAPDPDALAGRDWRTLAADPDGAEAREAGRAIEAGGTWEGSLRFRYARVEVTLATGVGPVARSSELMVMSLLPPGRSPQSTATTPEGAASTSVPASMIGIEQGPTMGRDGFRALVSAYDAQQDLEDPASIAHAVLQAIESAIGFDWAAVFRYVPGPSLALEVVATYPTPMAGISRGARWSPPEADEALVHAIGEPSIQGDLRRRAGSKSPLDRLPAFGLRSRILIPLFAGAEVAGALALFRNGPLAFSAAEGILAERMVRRLGEALAAPEAAAALTQPAATPGPVSTPPDATEGAPAADAPPAQPAAAGDYRAPIIGAADSVDRSMVSSRLESLGELVAGVAHELNNPLTSILGYAQILSGLEGTEREHALHTIEDEAQRAARIVRNLLSFARQRPGQRQLVNIEEMLRRVIDLRRYALEVDNVHVITHLGLVPEVELDEGQFEQVFLNLLNNAQQALQNRGGEVVITTWQAGGNVYVTFADNGPGVPEELHARIFEPFFTTREVGHGQGMGLAIVYGVVTHHGGRTWVETNAEGGATFAIELPIRSTKARPTKDSVVASAAPEPPADSPAAALPEHVTGRILVVDDEGPVRALTTEILAAAGYTVRSAADGIEALRLVEEAPFDLIVTDLRMPGMDGATLYRQIVERWPDLEERVLFVTGDIEGEPNAESLDSASVRYLEKPFTTRQLVDAVRESLSRASTPGTQPNP